MPATDTTTSAAWTFADAPDQTGRVAVVTGANTGIGFETARMLAHRGALVVLACRSADRANAAAARIAEPGADGSQPAAPPETVTLDLASLDSIEHAAEELQTRHPRIDLLINNAGVMATPYGTTSDGFETQLGINHLGPFALTGRLLPALADVPGSRIVTVSSLAHNRGKIDFSDLAYTRDYKRTYAYGRSKLANLLFTFELNRRLTEAGAPTIALAAHPGFAKSELSRNEPAPVRVIFKLILSPLLEQSTAMGALPTLRAATDPAAKGGEYYGPDRPNEQKGHPVLVSAIPAAHDTEVQQKLWSESEKMTGVVFPV